MPSAADGKGPLPSAARKQTAKELFTVAFFAGAFCHPRLTAKSPLPSVADGKEPAYWLFFLFFLESNNFHSKYI